MLQIFDFGYDLPCLLVLRIKFDAHFLRLGEDVALSGELGNKHPLAVADRFRGNVLVSTRIAQNRRHVDAPLMGESSRAYIRLSYRHVHIGDLTDVAGRIRKLI
ncbi:hypothetical protein D3C77_491520 [compost metagenome]